MSIGNAVEGLLQDSRYALRMMRRPPGFTAVAVLSLAFGTGANTAIFSLIHVLMLHNLPVRDPGRLVELLQQYPGEPRVGAFSRAAYESYRDHNHVFSDLISVSPPAPVRMRGEGVVPVTVTGDRCRGISSRCSD